MKHRKYWLTELAFGAFLPRIVAWFVVSPLKGLPIAGGWKPAKLMMALQLNGDWGCDKISLTLQDLVMYSQPSRK